MGKEQRETGETGNGKRARRNGRRETGHKGNGKRETGSGKRETGHRVQDTGTNILENGKRDGGNGLMFGSRAGAPRVAIVRVFLFLRLGIPGSSFTLRIRPFLFGPILENSSFYFRHSHFPTTLKKRTAPHPPPRNKNNTCHTHPTSHPHYTRGPVSLNRVGGMSRKALKFSCHVF